MEKQLKTDIPIMTKLPFYCSEVANTRAVV
jgi:hypothetical protein